MKIQQFRTFWSLSEHTTVPPAALRQHSHNPDRESVPSPQKVWGIEMAMLITGLAQAPAQGPCGWKPKEDNKDSVRSSTEEALRVWERKLGERQSSVHKPEQKQTETGTAQTDQWPLKHFLLQHRGFVVVEVWAFSSFFFFFLFGWFFWVLLRRAKLSLAEVRITHDCRHDRSA